MTENQGTKTCRIFLCFATERSRDNLITLKVMRQAMERFSSSELFELRNAVPVDILIREVLPIPSKISEGVFRFLCPICNEFQTAINPNTNLARCFRCERNFNAIDLVMEIQGCGFKESVLFLKQLLGEA